ncbi:uncharacterized protein LOC143556467 [Bidens hawaiensis]|uniref:uncharacterized protein LOC143556467 n=1 Tax=Bidens hawaiensis TaxID=980011 RepID=UPI00404926A5
MWKQFDAMVQLPSCSCQASKGFNDLSQLIKLMQFLMGLDDVYQPVRTNLLTRDPLPTVKAAFAIISREESHRSANGSKSHFQNLGFAAKANQPFDNKKGVNKGPNPNFKYTHCGKIGHTVERCFELVGYPQGSKPKTNNFSNQGSKNNSNSSNNGKSGTSSNSNMTTLTSNQISRLLGLLDKNDQCPSASNIGGNYVGSFSKGVFCFTSGLSTSFESTWVVDSGANQHMIMNDKNVFNQVDVTKFNIKLSIPMVQVPW